VVSGDPHQPSPVFKQIGVAISNGTEPGVDTEPVAARDHPGITHGRDGRELHTPSGNRSIAAVTTAAATTTADIDVPVAHCPAVTGIELVRHQWHELPPAFGRQPGRLLNSHEDLTPATLKCCAGSG
jgi:hypothetical protein